MFSIILVNKFNFFDLDIVFFQFISYFLITLITFLNIFSSLKKITIPTMYRPNFQHQSGENR